MKRVEAEALALEGLQYIAADDAELERFIALSGIAPSDMREAAQSADFLSGVLDYFMGDEATLVAFAASRGRDPASIAVAREVLSKNPGRG